MLIMAMWIHNQFPNEFVRERDTVEIETDAVIPLTKFLKNSLMSADDLRQFKKLKCGGNELFVPLKRSSLLQEREEKIVRVNLDLCVKSYLSAISKKPGRYCLYTFIDDVSSVKKNMEAEETDLQKLFFSFKAYGEGHGMVVHYDKSHLHVEGYEYILVSFALRKEVTGAIETHKFLLVRLALTTSEREEIQRG